MDVRVHVHVRREAGEAGEAKAPIGFFLPGGILRR